MNINDSVRLKLTPKGEQIVLTYYEGMHSKGFERLVKELLKPTFTVPLWEFAAIFGNHLSLGLDVPFDTEIEVVQ